MEEQINGTAIYTLDADYLAPKVAAIHLLRDGDKLALVDTGTQYSVPNVEQAITSLGLGWENVEFIILTHIHLDHAGGAGALMALCPNAQLVVHPKGARHMAQPEKLIAGATAVYGEEKFKQMYGEIRPIDAGRIVEPKDGETLMLGNRLLQFVNTPGHAKHHHCIFDEQSNSFFTGDTTGVGYVALRDNKNAYVMPTTTPVQFDPDAMHQSIDKIMAFRPDNLYLTHYGATKPSVEMIDGLHSQIDAMVKLTEQASSEGEEFERNLARSLLVYSVKECRKLLPKLGTETIVATLAMDIKLNAQGLVHWYKTRP